MTNIHVRCLAAASGGGAQRLIELKGGAVQGQGKLKLCAGKNGFSRQNAENAPRATTVCQSVASTEIQHITPSRAGFEFAGRVGPRVVGQTAARF